MVNKPLNQLTIRWVLRNKASMTSQSTLDAPKCWYTCTLPEIWSIYRYPPPKKKHVWNTCFKAHRFWYLMLKFYGCNYSRFVFLKKFGSQSQNVFSNIFAGLCQSYERSAVEPLACHARGQVMMKKWCLVVVKLIMAFTFLRGSTYDRRSYLDHEMCWNDTQTWHPLKKQLTKSKYELKDYLCLRMTSFHRMKGCNLLVSHPFIRTTFYMLDKQMVQFQWDTSEKSALATHCFWGN